MEDAPQQPTPAESGATRLQRYPSLHRYLIQAMVNRGPFLSAIAGADLTKPGDVSAVLPSVWAHMLLWYGCLYIVVEGWRTERINYAPVSDILRDKAKLDRLRDCRNAVFHYSTDYVDPRIEALMKEPGFVAWVHSLYDEMSVFFLAPDAP